MWKGLFGLVVIIALLLAASYYWREQYPWLETLHQALGLPASPSGLTSLPIPSGQQVFYRWQDSDGSWHYDTRPPQGIPYERIQVDPDANLLPGMERPE